VVVVGGEGGGGVIVAAVLGGEGAAGEVVVGVFGRGGGRVVALGVDYELGGRAEGGREGGGGGGEEGEWDGQVLVVLRSRTPTNWISLFFLLLSLPPSLLPSYLFFRPFALQEQATARLEPIFLQRHLLPQQEGKGGRRSGVGGRRGAVEGTEADVLEGDDA
jgi:hypothetical protein